MTTLTQRESLPFCTIGVDIIQQSLLPHLIASGALGTSSFLEVGATVLR